LSEVWFQDTDQKENKVMLRTCSKETQSEGKKELSGDVERSPRHSSVRARFEDEADAKN